MAAIVKELYKNIHALEKATNNLFPQFTVFTRDQWRELGDYVSSQEKVLFANIPHDKYMTLRLDGAGFSNKIKKLRKAGKIEPGISDTFSNIMNKVALSLAAKFNAIYVHVHSDNYYS